MFAKVAQLVEQLICNQPVVGSNPIFGSRIKGSLPEWLKGTDCKSVDLRLPWFETTTAHESKALIPTVMFLLWGLCPSSSVVEHFLGKEEVSGPTPDLGF